jgi:hypothetical protein
MRCPSLSPSLLGIPLRLIFPIPPQQPPCLPRILGAWGPRLLSPASASLSRQSGSPGKDVVSIVWVSMPPAPAPPETDVVSIVWVRGACLQALRHYSHIPLGDCSSIVPLVQPPTRRLMPSPKPCEAPCPFLSACPFKSPLKVLFVPPFVPRKRIPYSPPRCAAHLPERVRYPPYMGEKNIRSSFVFFRITNACRSKNRWGSAPPLQFFFVLCLPCGLSGSCSSWRIFVENLSQSSILLSLTLVYNHIILSGRNIGPHVFHPQLSLPT